MKRKTPPPAVYCMPGFNPGSQSRGKRVVTIRLPPGVVTTKRHPAYASCKLDGSSRRAVIFKLMQRRDILRDNPRVFFDMHGEEIVEIKLKLPPHGFLDQPLLNRQLESVDVGRGSKYNEIPLVSSYESITNSK